MFQKGLPCLCKSKSSCESQRITFVFPETFVAILKSFLPSELVKMYTTTTGSSGIVVINGAASGICALLFSLRN